MTGWRPPGCHSRDQRRVNADWAHRGSTTWRAERSIPATQNLVKKGGVVLTVLLLIVRKIAFPINRVHAANQFARTAVHALIGVDVHHSGPLVDAVGGALLHARLVHHIHASATDHVSHRHQATQPLSAIAPAEGPSRKGPNTQVTAASDAGRLVYANQQSVFCCSLRDFTGHRY